MLVETKTKKKLLKKHLHQASVITKIET